MTTPDERAFILFPRGKVRDDIVLASLRNGLRELVNPETGVLFTEEEIRIATQEGSRDFIEADAIDVTILAGQSRARFLADQVRPDRTNTNFLRNVWAPLYDITPLPAVGGAGTVNAPAANGTVFVGSTTIPDPAAHNARDAAGNLYQVLETVVTPVSGVAPLTMRGINTGDTTNLASGAELTWVNSPPGAEPTALTSAAFTGGTGEETDAELLDRLLDRIKNRPASGNDAQMRAWARQSTSAVETAFVYATALNAGSTIVCVTQKRGATLGPLARIAGSTTLGDVTTFIAPPASPVVPSRPFVLVVAGVSAPSDLVLRLSLRKASAGGWNDAEPWPGFTAAQSVVGTVTTQTDFEINSDTALPGGATALSGAASPQLMVWNDALSRFERLNMTSVDDSPGGGDYRVQLSAAPTKTIATGDVISPYTARLETIDQALEAYFDGLGPGELVGSTDPRISRAFRFPETNEEFPSRAGEAMIATLADALGASLSVAELTSISVTSAAVPTDPVDGPTLITLGTVGIYELP